MEDYSRVTGLVSNLDTNGMVKKLIQVEKIRIDRVKGDRQRLEWKQEGYRELAGMLKGFESEYFDVLNKKNDLMLESTYNIYKSSVKIAGREASHVSVEVKPEAKFERITIEQIEQLASPEKYKAKRALKTVSANVNFTNLNASLQSGGTHSLRIAIDGKEKTIDFAASGYQDFDELKRDLQAKLDAAFGKHSVKLSSETASGGEEKLVFQANNRRLDLKSNSTNLPAGFTVLGSSNHVDFNAAISSLIPFSGTKTIDISFLADNQKYAQNGKDRPKQLVEISASDSLKDVIRKINAGQQAATLAFDAITGKFSLTSKKMGADGELAFNNADTEDFFAKLGLDANAREAAKNAIVKIDGEMITSTRNIIDYAGARITLNRTYNTQEEQDAGKVFEPIEVSKEYSTDELKEKFKGFIKKYNEIIDKVKTMIHQKKNYKFDPLTDEQKKDLKEQEIKDWTEKAKEGLFRNDTGLMNMLSDLRRIFTDKVKGAGITMSELGVYFTDNYKDMGKIKLDEVKFDKAFKERPEEAMRLLTSKSDVPYGLKAGRKQRYDENGIMARIKDVIDKNIKTTKYNTGEVDSKGQAIYGPRGYLVEKAGLKDTSTEFNSELSQKIRKMNKRIDRMMDILAQKEQKYYMDFARLEKMLAQLSNQSNAFAGLMGN